MLLGFLLAGPRLVRADDSKPDPESLIRHGIQLRKSHDEEGAAREFQKAYDLAPTPRAAGQLGLAEQALGRWEDAEQHVREALRAEADPWVAKNRPILADALGLIQGHLGRIEVIGDPPGTDVLVNGRPAGKLPLAGPIAVSAGEVDVELRAAGYLPAQRTLTIVAGQYQRVVIRLAQEPARAVSDPVVAPPPASGTQPSATAGRPAPAQPDTEGSSTTRTVLKWGAAGLAIAGLASGVAFTILQSENVSAFDSYKVCMDNDGTAVVRGTTTPAPQCQASLDAERLDTKLAIASYVAAGVFAVTWLALQLTEPPRPASHGARALAAPLCAPSFTGLGMACALRF